MKFVQAHLSAGQVGQSSFNPVGRPVKLVEDQFMYQERSRKQFAPLCMSCEALACLFECQK